MYLRKQSRASFGELTIGWPLILKEVFNRTGTFVFLYMALNRLYNFFSNKEIELEFRFDELVNKK